MPALPEIMVKMTNLEIKTEELFSSSSKRQKRDPSNYSLNASSNIDVPTTDRSEVAANLPTTPSNGRR